MVEVVFVTVVLSRFFVPLLIPRYSLPAILACLVIDAADQTVFQAVTDDPLDWYQTYDKALDIFYLAIAYITAMRTWRDPVAFQTLRFLYFYRLVGVLLFELLDTRFLLLLFPNTFEYFFIAYESIRTRWNPLRLTATAVVGLAAFIWVFIKLPQEWWIHVAQNDFTDFMGEHPLMWLVLAALAALAALVGYRYRSSIPAADWPFTVDVERHLPEVEHPSRRPVLSPILIEKIVFMSIISVIFAQVLPGIESSNLGVAFGIALLVVSNAVVSEWLRRRGHAWSTTAAEFFAMLVINVGIVALDALLGATGRPQPNLNTLFFVVLLSLLIALFDRMRTTRGETDLRESALRAWRAESRANRESAVSGSTTDA
jgi:hypothetical protein